MDRRGHRPVGAQVVANRAVAESAVGDDSARLVVEIVAEELGLSLRWTTARPERATSVVSRY